MRHKPKRIRRFDATPAILLLVCFGIFCLSYAVFVRTPSAAAGESRIQVVTEEETVLVPVPSRMVARGEKLQSIPIAVVRWPKSKLGAGYILNIEQYGNRFAASALPAELPIPVAAITEHDLESNAVAEAIPREMRAITVRVDAESAVEGWAQSGNYVDVILIRAKKEGGLESTIIAENVRILSAGASVISSANTENAPKMPGTITLLTSQQDALRIKTAIGLGKLTFALRGIGDELRTTMTTLDQRELFASPPSPAPPLQVSGRARGPDGNTYLLERNSSWKKASSETVTFGLDASHSRSIRKK